MMECVSLHTEAEAASPAGNLSTYVEAAAAGGQRPPLHADRTLLALSPTSIGGMDH